MPPLGCRPPGSTVSIALADQEATAKAGPDGQWRTTIGSLKAGGPFEMTVTAGGEVTTIKNVAVGEVWIGSGQSNMELNMGNCLDPKAINDDDDWPMIRMFTVAKQASPTPLDETTGDYANLHGWMVSAPNNHVDGWSAAGFFFARELHQRLNVPVGIINASWGGTPSEAWTSPETVASEPAFAPLGPSWEEIAKGYSLCLESWNLDIARWQQEADAAKAANRPVPWRPMPPIDPIGPLAPPHSTTP